MFLRILTVIEVDYCLSIFWPLFNFCAMFIFRVLEILMKHVQTA